MVVGKYKQVKPKLLDSNFHKKIVDTLNPPKDDYWAPAKNSFNKIFNSYIKPNITIIVVIFLFLVFLLYRYRQIKLHKERIYIEQYLKNYYPNNFLDKNINDNEKYVQPNDDYIFLHKLEKSYMTEPPINKKH